MRPLRPLLLNLMPLDRKPPAAPDVPYKHKPSLGYLMPGPQSEGRALDGKIPAVILPPVQNFTAENMETRVADSNALGLLYSFVIDDHRGIEVFGGIPPEIGLMGKGVAHTPITHRPSRPARNGPT